jgi:hypothetical protein
MRYCVTESFPWEKDPSPPDSESMPAGRVSDWETQPPLGRHSMHRDFPEQNVIALLPSRGSGVQTFESMVLYSGEIGLFSMQMLS